MTVWNRGPELSIRGSADIDDYPRLVEIWRSAVDATHDFLADDHRDEIESRLASDYFPQVDLFVAESAGVVVGFVGISEANLEMLFIDARHQGGGAGSALLEYVVAERGVTALDVNEQNAAAADFYRRRGFVVVGRSAVDEQGRPYPLLHMELGNGDTTVDAASGDPNMLPR